MDLSPFVYVYRYINVKTDEHTKYTAKRKINKNKIGPDNKALTMSLC